MNLNAPASSLYCERTSADFWAEPLNAGTSALVIVIAIYGSIRLWREGLLSPNVVVMMILACLIGVGSFLLHTFATRWSEVADVLPIWLFVAFYALTVTREFARGAFRAFLFTAVCITVFVSGVTLAMGAPMPLELPVSGSTQYVPATLTMVVVLWFLWKNRHPAFSAVAIGIGLFGVALSFRSLDLWLCGSVSTGTHFLWHLSNCLVFWFLIRAYAVHDGNRPA